MDLWSLVFSRLAERTYIQKAFDLELNMLDIPQNINRKIFSTIILTVVLLQSNITFAIKQKSTNSKNRWYKVDESLCLFI